MDTSRLIIIAVVLLAVGSPQLLALKPGLQHMLGTLRHPVPQKEGLIYSLPGEEERADKRSSGGNFHISVCNSKEYKSVGVSTRDMLKHHFPDKETTLTIHPLPEGRLMLDKLLTAVQVFLWFATWTAHDLLVSFGVANPPAFFLTMKRHKFFAIFAVWVAGYYLRTKFISQTGAFEVFFDGQRIFSAIAEGRVPTIPELLAVLSGLMEHEN